MSDTLFTATTVGDLEVPSRIVMAPMTRSRASAPNEVPNADMAEYYRQRAGAGLIITEATQISAQARGYSFTPGIYTDEQVHGWRAVTDAVHAAGGRIFSQLWHVGRMSHSSFHDDGLPVAPSALSADATVWVADADGNGAMQPTTTPRALETDEIAGIVDDYRRAARNADRAGFDGVEIHGGNGYLIDQFLRTGSNHRTDRYGVSIENRIRFLLEVVTAAVDELGADRVGLRLSPLTMARNMECPEIVPAIMAAAAELDRIGIAYIHIAEADWDDAPTIPLSFRQQLREAFGGRIIVAGGYDAASGTERLDSGLVDLIAFGRPFVANPDLPERMRHDWPLAELDRTTLFGGGAEGYTTYEVYAAKEAALA